MTTEEKEIKELEVMYRLPGEKEEVLDFVGLLIGMGVGFAFLIVTSMGGN